MGADPGAGLPAPEHVEGLEAQEIALPERHAVMTQNRVRGRDVEVEIRQHEAGQVIVTALEMARALASAMSDGAALGAVKSSSL